MNSILEFRSIRIYRPEQFRSIRKYWPEQFRSIRNYWPEQFRSVRNYWPEGFRSITSSLYIWLWSHMPNIFNLQMSKNGRYISVSNSLILELLSESFYIPLSHVTATPHFSGKNYRRPKKNPLKPILIDFFQNVEKLVNFRPSVHSQKEHLEFFAWHHLRANGKRFSKHFLLQSKR